jgi:hypothetical protein
MAKLAWFSCDQRDSKTSVLRQAKEKARSEAGLIGGESIVRESESGFPHDELIEEESIRFDPKSGVHF